MFVIHKPKYNIWVEGRPQSFQKKRLVRYKERIQQAARSIVPRVLRTPRIDVEIWFHAYTSLRADVDNVIKPILDALKGIVYEDDRQVRSVRVVALPDGDAFGIESSSGDALDRLMGEPDQFLIKIYVGITVPSSNL